MSINFFEGREKLPVSALVVSLNEGYLLQDCLNSISFCDEILVADLMSTDDTESIAQKHKAIVLKHEPLPVVEMFHKWLSEQAKNDWVLITDPDERIDAVLVKQVMDLFNNIQGDIAIIRVPILFYMRKRALKGTVWGGDNSRPLLINKQRVVFSPHVHAGIRIKEGYKVQTLPFNGTRTNVDHHLWMSSYSQLFEKHHRYLKKEGDARYARGERFSFKNLMVRTSKAFYYSFFYKKGYQDGLTGFALSLFWAYYNWRIQFSIRRIEKQQKQV